MYKCPHLAPQKSMSSVFVALRTEYLGVRQYFTYKLVGTFGKRVTERIGANAFEVSLAAALDRLAKHAIRCGAHHLFAPLLATRQHGTGLASHFPPCQSLLVLRLGGASTVLSMSSLSIYMW